MKALPITRPILLAGLAAVLAIHGALHAIGEAPAATALTKEIAHIELPGIFPNPEDLSGSEFISFLAPMHPEVGLVVALKGKISLLNPTCTEIVNTVSLPAPAVSAITVPGVDALFVLQSSGALSRVDLSADTPAWTTDLDLFDLYLTETTTRDLISRDIVKTTAIRLCPANAMPVRGSREIDLLGLELQMSPLWPPASRMVRLNSETGEITSELRFDLRRPAGHNRTLLIDIATSTVVLLDLKTGSRIVRAELTPGDLLFPAWQIEKKILKTVTKATFNPFDRMAPIDAGLDDYWNVAPVVTEDQLLITSRRIVYKRLGHSLALEETAWAKFDLEGNRLGRLNPAPRASADLEIRNQSSSGWPKLLVELSKRHLSKLDGSWPVQGIVMIRQDGTVERSPVPEFGKKPRFFFPPRCNWLHDGKRVYALVKGVLYEAKIGERSSTVLWKSPKGRKHYDVSDGHGDYVVLTTSEEMAVIRLSDGAEVSPDELSDLDAAGFVVRLNGIRRALSKLPTDGVPPGFKDYYCGHSVLVAALRDQAILRGAAAIEEYRHITKSGRKKTVPGWPIWGKRSARVGDMSLVPAELKDGLAALVGIGDPDWRIEFWVPVEKRGTRKARVFPFAITNRTEESATLVVSEGGNLLKVYKIRRPGLDQGDGAAH